MITIALTYFKSLTLVNLMAALYSVRRQDFSQVEELVVVDNDTADDPEQIRYLVASFNFPVHVRVVSHKHGDRTLAQAWSTNQTVRLADTEWVFYTRADYLLDFDMLAKFAAIVASKPIGWDGFIVSHGCHLGEDITGVEQYPWRDHGTRVLKGIVYDYTEIDSGVWMARRGTYDRIGGFDERLSAWGHAQTEFQYRMHLAGVEFVRVPETLFYHPGHGGDKDMGLANQQLAVVGTDLKVMWARYHGESPYGR
jgi:predicted glycosyltransferase involved in capsule biosynthesis